MIAGSHGVTMTFDLKADLTGATEAKIVFKGPGPTGTRKTVTATLPGDLSTGIITYITEEHVFEHSGEYLMQGRVKHNAAKLLKTDVKELTVEEAL